MSELPQAVEWLFLDLNSYFASVEQQVRPELRGRPIAIVPLITKNTCCIAASYEAKAYGVKTGVNADEAKLLCPKIELVEARPKLYVEFHHRIVEAVERCVHVSMVMSIDEMACQLMGSERNYPKATKIAYQIKAALREVGETLRCSIGIAPNRYLAKVASDMQKPDGLRVILLSDLPQCLYSLKPGDLSGIGSRMEQRLAQRGITTVPQLCVLSREEMRDIWHSVIGERLWYWLRGENFHDPSFKRKSMGKQHVLAPEFRTREKAYGVTLKLLHIAAANMRKINMWAQGIGVTSHFLSVKGSQIDPSWEAHKRIYSCCDTFTLQKYLGELWQNCPPYPPLQVGVWLYDLVPDEAKSGWLFEDGSEKSRAASLVMDKLNKKHGQQSVYLGGMHGALEAAPTRISFMSIPELNEF